MGDKEVTQMWLKYIRFVAEAEEVQFRRTLRRNMLLGALVGGVVGVRRWKREWTFGQRLEMSV